MRINFDGPVTALDGTPALDDGKPQYMKSFVLNALLSTQLEPNLSAEDKFVRGVLAQKVYTGGDLDLKAEEIALIKTTIGLYYPPLVVLRIFNHIEDVGNTPAPAKTRKVKDEPVAVELPAEESIAQPEDDGTDPF